MNKNQLGTFVSKLLDESTEGNLTWSELDIEDITYILKNSSNYSTIVGAFECYNEKQRKSIVVGKYKLRVYYQEEIATNEEYVFLSIADPLEYSSAIVFTEDEFSNKTIEELTKLYRTIELDISNVVDIIDSWFE